MGFNRFAKTFAINLYSILLKLIGQNLETFLGLLVFGINEMKVWFKFGGMTPEFSTEMTASDTSTPIFSQKFL